MAYDLKPFVINTNDLVYLLNQVNFQPLFDAAGNAVVAWDGVSAVNDVNGLPVTLLATPALNWAAYGQGFPSVAAPIGIRDVTGFHNNLFGTQAQWGAVEQPFVRLAPADYTSYVTSGAAYTSTGSITDLMPRIISRTITTGGVNLLTDGPNGTGHYVVWDHLLYANSSPEGVAYKAMIDSAGVDTANLVDGVKIVAPVTTEVAILDNNGDPLAYSQSYYNFSLVYTTTLSVFSAIAVGGLKDSAGGALTEGEAIWYRPSAGAALINTSLTFQPDALVYKQLIDANVDFSAAAPAEGTPITSTLVESGYGLLETLGHIDYQNPNSGEFFIGSENPGVAPVNSWFAIFGQFFDHGLDKLAAGGNGTITIALDPNDPLYGAIGPNGPVTSIKVTRATNIGTADVPNYANHTSPFIDQSQTYGSHEQLTNLLRKWESTDGGVSYHAGMDLLDGTTLADTWTRKWPDGTTSEVNDTLPTLNELRAHLMATGRDDLSWEDVTNLRNRDADGHVAAGESGSPLLLDMNPRFTADHLYSSSGFRDANNNDVQDVGETSYVGFKDDNHNGVLDGAEKTQIQIVDDAIAVLSANVRPGDTFGMVGGVLSLTLGTDFVAGPTTIPAGTVLTGASAMMEFVDFSNFSIYAPAGALHDAVGEVLKASVGDHYIAGDGRVNENFGLTSIHHVFHEEHNYQVQNLQTWIYAHDGNNSPNDHAGLHEWQISSGQKNSAGELIVVDSADLHVDFAPGDVEVFKLTGESLGFAAVGDVFDGEDTNGNYLNIDGSIAWDPDKMFNATKLIVEMEYQHAAVDQYARTITPRIQEFVGYSSGVDSTITLEYAQVAFRFGHSTIRETIDTIDPTGWFKGAVTTFALESAFLAPQTYAQEGVAAITLGLSRQQMNEVDEFITPALNQGLLGQPLDLAAINIARGRDMGIPTLNDFREAISLARYTSWQDFGAGMFHPESLVSFIAAYSFGGDVAMAQEILDLADGTLLVDGPNFTIAEALAFMNNNATGDAALDIARDGFNHIDSWIGGLAEAHVPGGLLGETFDAVFVAQIQSLMDGDRFYYLYRLFGTQIAEEVNNGQFKDLVERNTGLEHLNGSIFAYADVYYDFNRDALPINSVLHNLAGDLTYYTDENGQLYETRTGAGTALSPYLYSDKINAANPLPVGDAALFNNLGQNVGPTDAHAFGLALAANAGVGIYSDGGATTANNGLTILIDNQTYIRDIRPELDPNQTHPLEGTPVSGADSHEVIVGTDRNDFIHARGGDDTVYGDDGDDIIYGDGGIDRLYGGAGNDYLDSGEGPDLVDGGAGKDTIYGRGSGSEVGGFDQLVGGSGNDLVIGGEGIDKLSSGSGDDIVFGDGLSNPEMGNTDPFTHAGDGNDYVDGGASGDLIYGEEGDDFLVGGTDQDLIQGGTGDDIIRPGNPSQAIGGGPDEVIGDDGYVNSGFDLVDFSDYAAGGPGINISLDAMFNPLIAIDGTTPVPAMAQIEGIIGTSGNDTLGADVSAIALAEGLPVHIENNWLIGGSGNDVMTGSAGSDLIIGGSVRLDQLIGKYADAANASGPGNLAIGSQAWIGDAMRTGSVDFTGANDGYDNDVQDAYTGSSNQATGALDTSGFLHAAGMDEIAHFQDMLKSRMFKDVVLGDGEGVADVGGVDASTYSGMRADYTITQVSGGGLTGFKIIDNRLHDANGFVVDVDGIIQTDVNGEPMMHDGTDLVVAVENFQFADVTRSAANLLNMTPTGFPLITGLENELTVVTTGILDPNGPANAAMVFTYQWQISTDGGATFVDILGSTSSTFTAPDQNFYRVVVKYTDGSGVVETVTSQMQARVGTTGNDGTALAPFAGNDAPNLLNGRSGNDFLDGGIGNDVINGGSGNDTIGGGDGNDTIYGGTGDDAIDGGAGDDLIKINLGDNGNDTILGGDDVDTLAFNDGTGNNNRTFNVDYDGASFISMNGVNGTPDVEYITADLGGGTDTLNYSANLVDVTVNLATGNASGFTSISNIENATGGDGNDTLTGNALANVIAGGAGNDRLVGGDASGVVDTAVFDGQAVNATYAYTNQANITVTTTDGGTDTVSGFESFRFAGGGGGGGGGGTTYNLVAGTNSNNILAGTAAVDLILGFNGNDTISTLMNGGADVIIGGGNTDVLNISGTTGNDTLTVSYTGVTLISGINGGSISQIETINADFLDGTSDTLAYSNNSNGVTVNLGTSTASGFTSVLGLENVSGGSGADNITGNASANALNGGGGNDQLFGAAGDDTITYSVTTGFGGGGAVTSGRDFIDGGTTAIGGNGRDTGSDTFVLNGTNNAETFKIMTRDAAIAAGVLGLNANTEIVITRQAGNGVANNVFTNLVVLAELDNIEEIRVNTLNVTADNNNGGLDGGSVGGDTVQILGNFGTATNAATSLNFNTITIDGGVDDKVDITGLTSEHRIVFQGAVNSNQFIGNVRPQDVVGFESNDTDEEEEESEGSETPPAAVEDLTLMGDASENLLTGDAGDDVAMGLGAADTISVGSGDDFVDAGAGDDYVFAGSGNDMIYGGDGADVIMGGDGNDLITAGNGDDNAMGGAGNDYFVASNADGADRYSGDVGSDTLDMSAISANIEANLGTGLSGYAQILNGPRDTLYGIENIVTGSGNDTVTASGAHNVIDTGAGQDTVVFRSASDADGDTLLNFEAGDQIDVSAFMGGTISLINGNAASAGQIAVHFENIGNENFTVLDGLTQDGEHFKIDIKGHHNLTGTDFAA